MTHEEFISLVKQPEMATSQHASDLKELVDLYPYFAPARLFYAKALQQSGSVLFASNLKFSSLYSSNRRWLYYYIDPDKKISTEPYRREKTSKSGGDYFDLVNSLESKGGDSKQTLKNLADRLRSARALVVSATPHVVRSTSSENTEKTDKNFISESANAFEENQFSEDKAKKMIQERKYIEAIEIFEGFKFE